MRSALLAHLLVFVLGMIAGGAYAKNALLDNVPLQWRPTSDLKLGTRQMPQTAIQFEVFRDERDNKAAVGENREDDLARPVSTQDDVGAFVSTHMRELFESAGLKTVDKDGSVLIRGEVKEFFVRETSTYRSQVAVHLSVLDRSGNVLWSGTAAGGATRFGRSYKAENYFEVLSDGIVNTVSSMLQSAQFQKALTQ